MRHARRYIATLTALASWCIATTTTAYAMRPAPLSGGDVAPATPSTSAAGLPLWQLLAFVALGVLMAVAIVGLGYSLSHSRRPQSSRSPLRS